MTCPCCFLLLLYRSQPPQRCRMWPMPSQKHPLPPTSLLNFSAQDFLPRLLRARHCTRGFQHAPPQPSLSSPFLGHTQHKCCEQQIPAWLPEELSSTAKPDNHPGPRSLSPNHLFTPKSHDGLFWGTLCRTPSERRTGPPLCAPKHLPSTNGVMWLSFGLQNHAGSSAPRHISVPT